MGRPPSVLPEEIFAAADAISTESGKVSNREVLARLGRGSMSTICQAMRDWRAAQACAAGIDLTLPDDVQRAIAKSAEAKVAAARAALDADLAEERQVIGDLIVESERQAREIARQDEALVRAAAGRAAALGRAAQLATELERVAAALAREREAAEARRIEIAKAILQVGSIPSLEKELAAVRAELTSEQGKRVEFEAQAAVLRAFAHSCRLWKAGWPRC